MLLAYGQAGGLQTHRERQRSSQDCDMMIERSRKEEAAGPATCLLVRWLKIVKKLSLHGQARSRVSGCGVPFPSRRPCSDPAKSNWKVGQPAAKNSCDGDDDTCDVGVESGNPGKRLCADRLSIRRTACVQVTCSRASAGPAGVRGIAGVLGSMGPLFTRQQSAPRSTSKLA